ncbi:MAG: methylmalonyl-CoA mutase, partial [Puniceicoccaceae bacterium]
KAERDNPACQAALQAITHCMETGQGNVLELAVEAARCRATLGEISDAVEKVVGRYRAKIRSISGVYAKEFGNTPVMDEIKTLIEQFETEEGRRPRIMIAKMGQDGHDRGAKVVATGYADLGFDVDIGPLFQTPEETARQAVENDCHIVAMSSLAAGHKTLLPALIAELTKLGRPDIMVICGGVIPAQDYDFLYQQGAKAIFGPGTVIPESARKMLQLLLAEQ